MAGRIAGLGLVLALAGAGYAAYELLGSRLALAIYRERLAELGADYEALRGRYNEAVRKTAVTELVVRDGALAVRVRTADGLLRTVPTALDPAREIYVDFVVVDGRLWIRRVFDGETPPARGVVVDPLFADVDWDAEGAAHGKAAYRRLSEGRWVVTVTGDGALGLARAKGDEPGPLAPPPSIREYEPIEEEVEDALARIHPAEAFRALARRFASARL